MKQTLQVKIKTTNKQWDHRKFYFNGGKFVSLRRKTGQQTQQSDRIKASRIITFPDLKVSHDAVQGTKHASAHDPYTRLLACVTKKTENVMKITVRTHEPLLFKNGQCKSRWAAGKGEEVLQNVAISVSLASNLRHIQQRKPAIESFPRF